MNARQVERLAAAHKIGAVGIIAQDSTGAVLRFFVAEVELHQARAWALDIAERENKAVEVFHVFRTPYSHPAHLAGIEWRNTSAPPAVPCPRGAVAQIDRPGRAPQFVQLEELAHFRAVSPAPPRLSFAGCSFWVPAGPIGGFLL